MPPNGNSNSHHRPLLDKGIVFILETCRSMFNFAIKRRHLSPYAENPFAIRQLERMSIEGRRSIERFSPDQERAIAGRPAVQVATDWLQDHQA